MLNALQISQQFPSREYPALGVMVQNTVRALARQPSVQVEVLAPRPYTLPIEGFPYGQLARLPLQARDSGFKIHRPHYVYLVPKRLLYPLVGPAFAHTARKYASSLRRPDVIHAHWAYPDGAGAVALRKLFRCPLVVHARGSLERVVAKQSKSFRELVRQPLLAADAVIANSLALRDDCLELGVAPARLHVIPNGIDLELFSPRDKRDAKRELGLPAGRQLVLFCGNLRPVKGVDLLADAIPELLRRHPSALFAFLGEGELEPMLRTTLAGAIAGGDVQVLGAKRQREVATYMAAADLLVLPSRSEARANVIAEALACATAVAATSVGGIPELVRPEHGRLFEPNSSAALIAGVDALLADRDSLEELGRAGRRFIQGANLSWDTHAARTVELYRSLLASPRHARSRSLFG